MGGDQGGDSLGAHHAQQQLHDVPAGLQVELAGWLVGDQQAWPAGQRAGDGDPLLLAPGEFARPVRSMAGQAGQRQHGRHPLPALAGPHARDAQRNPHVLGGGQHGNEPEGLENEGDRVPPQRQPVPLGHPAHLAAIHPHLARRRAVQAADDVQQRGLAGAGSPAQGSELAPAYRERHPPQRVHGRVPAAEGPGNILRCHHDLGRLATISCAVRSGHRGVVLAHTR